MSVDFIFANKNSHLCVERNSSKYIFQHQISQLDKAVVATKINEQASLVKNTLLEHKSEFSHEMLECLTIVEAIDIAAAMKNLEKLKILEQSAIMMLNNVDATEHIKIQSIV